jgi:uncharacterized membrane protein YfcA
MALFGLEPAVMRPAALTMNVFVTLLVLSRLAHAGLFNWRLFLPFAVSSVPMAFIGGAYTINSSTYRVLVGVALLFATWRLLWTEDEGGGILGVVSGLTGVGGGIFLSPLLLLFHWSTMRGSLAVAAAFILVNSLAGLAGYAASGNAWPSGIPLLVITAVLGALIGSELGLRRLPSVRLRKVLAVVLTIAGLKLMATAWS